MIAQRGWTLIEAMIAIALGVTICAVASGLMRVAQSSVRAANHLAITNHLLRAGVEAALDDLDTWDSFDDASLHPVSPAAGPDAAHPLRAIGQPFAPFSADPATTWIADTDLSKPLHWYRGEPIDNRDRLRGDYALFACDGNAANAHPEYDATTAALARTVGYYGLFAFGPVDRFYCYRTRAVGDGEVTAEYASLDPRADGTRERRLYTDTGISGGQPRDWSACQYKQAVVVTTDPWYLAGDAETYPNISRHVFSAGVNNGAIDVGFDWRTMLSRCGSRLPLMPLAPAHWPIVAVRTNQLIAMSRELHTATVALTDPTSGHAIAIYLTTVATDLRGARRQRGLTP